MIFDDIFVLFLVARDVSRFLSRVVTLNMQINFCQKFN